MRLRRAARVSRRGFQRVGGFVQESGAASGALCESPTRIALGDVGPVPPDYGVWVAWHGMQRSRGGKPCERTMREARGAPHDACAHHGFGLPCRPPTAQLRFLPLHAPQVASLLRPVPLEGSSPPRFRARFATHPLGPPPPAPYLSTSSYALRGIGRPCDALRGAFHGHMAHARAFAAGGGGAGSEYRPGMALEDFSFGSRVARAHGAFVR